MTKRTFKRKKMLISNTTKLIIIGNYHTVPIQNIDFQFYHNLQTGIFMNYRKLTIIRQR